MPADPVGLAGIEVSRKHAGWQASHQFQDRCGARKSGQVAQVGDSRGEREVGFDLKYLVAAKSVPDVVVEGCEELDRLLVF